MEYKIGSIGAGNMGGAILKGAVSAGAFKPSEIAVCVRSAESRARLAALGYSVLDSASQVFASCPLVMLAIKPQGMDAMLEELSAVKGASPLILSIVAGLTVSKIHQKLPLSPVIRAMPNTPLMLGCGATAVARTAGVSDEDFKRILDIFGAMGAAFEIPDELMNSVIPLNGSSPAFVYHFIESIARWGEAQGFDYQTALMLTAKAFEGAAKMVMQGEDDPETLIRRVCSPGGTTLEGMRVLKEQNVAKTLADVGDACVLRALELQ